MILLTQKGRWYYYHHADGKTQWHRLGHYPEATELISEAVTCGSKPSGSCVYTAPADALVPSQAALASVFSPGIERMFLRAGESASYAEGGMLPLH